MMTTRTTELRPITDFKYLTKLPTMEKREKVVKEEREEKEIREFHSVNMKKKKTKMAMTKDSWLSKEEKERLKLPKMVLHPTKKVVSKSREEVTEAVEVEAEASSRIHPRERTIDQDCVKHVINTN